MRSSLHSADPSCETTGSILHQRQAKTSLRRGQEFRGTVRSRSKQILFAGLVYACTWLPSGVAQTQPNVQYQTTSDWGTGFNGQIKIPNTTSQPITGWVLEFDFDRSIDTIWDATIIKHEGNHYSLQSAGWNATIAPGSAVSFGFAGSPGNV